jgi:hypothetical protein
MSINSFTSLSLASFVVAVTRTFGAAELWGRHFAHQPLVVFDGSESHAADSAQVAAANANTSMAPRR